MNMTHYTIVRNAFRNARYYSHINVDKLAIDCLNATRFGNNQPTLETMEKSIHEELHTMHMTECEGTGFHDR